ncbi:MAG: ribonuclease H [Actinomycetota bacterium]
MVEVSERTVVYTDGACRGNPGPGGWGWVVPDGPWANGFDPETTNQRMELMAVLDALRTIEGPVEVVSDSTYVVNCFRDGWWKGWLKRDWKNSKKEPVANRDLWEPLIELYRAREHELTFTWVKGHAGDEYNDIADRLAVEVSHTGVGRHGVGVPDDLGPPDEISAVPAAGPRPGPDGVFSSAWAPVGPAVLVTGMQPPHLGGYDPNPLADGVRRTLAEILIAKAALAPDLVVLTGLRLGAETLAAEAAAEAEVPFVAVLPYPEPERKWPPAAQRRFHELVAEATAVVRLEKKVPTDNRAAGQALDRRNGWLRTVATEAIVVWDHEEPRMAKVVGALEQTMPDDVWIVSP